MLTCANISGRKKTPEPDLSTMQIRLTLRSLHLLYRLLDDFETHYQVQLMYGTFLESAKLSIFRLPEVMQYVRAGMIT